MLRIFRSGGRRTKTIWWAITIVTVVTFLGGFVFILGSGLGSENRARMSGAIGVVDGMPITRADYQDAIADQRQSFKQRYGSEPGDRDLKMLEVQAWRSLAIQRIMTQRARALGLGATDHEVVVSLKSNPPPSVMTSPSFQTDGKFDASKYQAAMTNPNNLVEVARLEELTRRQLPMRKLQERLLTSIKLAEPEILEAYRNRYERLSATLVVVPGASDAKVPPPGEADLDRIYQKYKSRFIHGPRTQLEVLMVPKNFGDEEVRVARELAQSLVNRARKGEDFAALARDYSEGPGAENGGVIDRVFQLQEFGQELAPKIAALDTGAVADPVRDGGRFLAVKLLERTHTPMGQPGVKVAQIVVRIRPNEEQLRAQSGALGKLRSQATKIGLGKAAATKGMATAMTQFYDPNDTPPELFGEPEAADWGLTANKGAVSPVFEGLDEFVIVQVQAQSPAGPASREETAPQLRSLAELDARVERSKAKADSVAAALRAGRTLEQAAAAVGLTTNRVDGMTRVQPDPSLAGSPEVVGAAFAARPGQVVGPIRAVNGWYFARVEEHTQVDPAMLEQIKSQISSDLLQRRQQSFLSNYFAELRLKAKVKDLRTEAGF
jgi:peptidyl-prolyl cis-trans isomerase D